MADISIVGLSKEQKLEKIKDRLGWYFEDVRPIDWNPYDNVNHLGYLLRMTIKFEPDAVGTFFYDCIDDTTISILMMPYTPEGREKLIDICGSFLGIWYIPNDYLEENILN